MPLTFDDLQPTEGPNDVEAFCHESGHCVLDDLAKKPELLAAQRTLQAFETFAPASVVVTDR